MTKLPNTNGFPAHKLGTFLRAMEDPEGTGNVDAEREREIAEIEKRLADAGTPSPGSDGD